jgi:hypothetical protein
LQLINPSTSSNELNTTLTPHSMIHRDACFAYFNKIFPKADSVLSKCGRSRHPIPTQIATARFTISLESVSRLRADGLVTS